MRKVLPIIKIVGFFVILLFVIGNMRFPKEPDGIYYIGEPFKLGPLRWEVTSAKIKFVSGINPGGTHEALLFLKLKVKNKWKKAIPLRIYEFGIVDHSGESYYSLIKTSEKFLKTNFVYPYETKSVQLIYYSPEEGTEDISEYEINASCFLQSNPNEDPIFNETESIYLESPLEY